MVFVNGDDAGLELVRQGLAWKYDYSIPLDRDGLMSTAQWDLGVLANEIRSRKAADFRGWETDGAKFNDQVNRVIKALRADEWAYRTAAAVETIALKMPPWGLVEQRRYGLAEAN